MKLIKTRLGHKMTNLNSHGIRAYVLAHQLGNLSTPRNEMVLITLVK